MKKIFVVLIVLLCYYSILAETSYKWTRMSGNFGGYIGCMSSDNKGKIYAGTKALFSSTDEGESWSKISDKYSPYCIEKLVIKDSLMFADFSYAMSDMVFGYRNMSKDYGITWKWDTTYKYKDIILKNNMLNYGNNYYVGNGNVVLKSTDKGNTWIMLDTNKENSGNVEHLVIDRKGNLLYNFEYYGYSIKKYDPISDVITELVYDSTKLQNGITCICVDSSNNYYIGLYATNNHNHDYIYTSRDEGKNWVESDFKFDVADMIINKDNKLFVSTYDDGIFYSSDYGNSWIKTPSLLNAYYYFFLSPGGNLFIYGKSIYKYVEGKWIAKYEDIDALNVMKIQEQDNQLFCSGSNYGINSFVRTNNKWNSYVFDSNANKNYICNFVISGNNLIAVNYDSLVVLNFDNKKWVNKPLEKISHTNFEPSIGYLLNTYNELICFSNTNSKFTYLSQDYGENWTDLSSFFDSSVVLSNYVDKNGYIYLAKQSDKFLDSNKISIIISKDKGTNWEITNTKGNFPEYIYFTKDFSNNIILIVKNIFYKYNLSENNWDTIYNSSLSYNPMVQFISESKFITIATKDYWPSNTRAIVVDINSGKIDTIACDYSYIEFNSFFMSKDSSVYAATDRGVLKLDISTDIKDNSECENKISIYPIPAEEEINISYSNDKTNIESLCIINELGELIFENNNYDALRSIPIRINTQEYPSSTYFCILKIAGEVIVKKFIIIK